MKKIKIFYSGKSTTLNNGLNYLQGKVNTWINESGAEIVDVKMNINNNGDPVITVIYEAKALTVTFEKSQQNHTHEDMCGGWRAGYNLGYYHGRLAYHCCQIWEADRRRGYVNGYVDGFQSMQKKDKSVYKN